MELSPYLTFPGTCREALEFYAEIFGGQIEFLQLVKDSPMSGDMSPEAQDKVLHGRVRVGSVVVMASDHMQGEYVPPQGITLNVSFPDFDKAKRVFTRLAKDGEITMAFAPTFWAAGFGMCRDRFGVPWMVNCEVPPE